MKRPRIRFGLRSLLVLVLLVAGWCGWVAHRHREFKQHYQNTFALQSNGGFVTCQSGKYADHWLRESWWQMIWPPEPIDPVVRVAFQGTRDQFRVPIPDSEKYVTFESDWSLEGMLALREPLESLPQLRHLQFSKMPLPRHGLACIENLAQIDTLVLDQTQITSADIVHLKSLTNLRWLSLRRTRIDDDCLVHLKDLDKLETLHLGSTRIGDEGLKYLIELESLSSLSIDNTRVSDQGMQLIATFPALTQLHVPDSELTDEGLRNLDSAKNLRALTIGSDHISLEAAHKLGENLPECKLRIHSIRGRNR